MAILDFLYCGETNVYQENLDSFLAIAQELELKGLTGKTNQEEDTTTKPSEFPVSKNATFKDETIMTKSTALSSPRVTSRDSLTRTVAVANEHPSNNMQKLDEQINSLMTKSARKNKYGLPIYVCSICGKEGPHSHMKTHIEANHLEGISVPCNNCERIFRSRNAKATHISLFHRGQQDLA